MATVTAADGHELDAYAAQPPGDTRGLVVVVQEIFGVNDHIRSVVDRYAELGYMAVAPSLFDRVQKNVELNYDEEGIEVGRRIAFDDLSMDEVMMDIEATIGNYPQPGGVGIVGYCWGGSICYVAAARLSDKISAASGYYGGQIMPHIEEEPKAPLMLHFGAEDAGIPLENVHSIAQRWPQIDVHIYEEAGHGFNCDARGSYEESSAALALERTLEHFAQHLGD
ncbi:MAG TPA: carboxymethylenebutenolidase [Acidimicrobiaceae bacterium]|nr:carboxymethylenebutenolidase [Acidimicrobiaceae bacterium]